MYMSWDRKRCLILIAARSYRPGVNSSKIDYDTQNESAKFRVNCEPLMQSGNHQLLVNQLIEKTKKDFGVSEKSQAFELLISNQILQRRALDYEEVARGICDGADDGGVDALYMFVDGKLIDTEDASLNEVVSEATNDRPVVEIYIIQASTATGFSENKIKIMRASILDLFQIGQKNVGTYNEKVKSFFDFMSDLIPKLAIRRLRLHVSVCFASLQENSDPDPKVTAVALQIETDLKRLFTTIDVKVETVGCDLIFERHSKVENAVYELDLSNAKELSDSGSYVSVVPLTDFFDFIVDENGNLREEIFEANVRDYQSGVAVNKKIAITLRKNREDDFWWLNNGVTILADECSRHGNKLVLENPSIVNGLQTSNEIYNWFSGDGVDSENDNRRVLVKTIVATSPEAQARIIEATNSQTSVNVASIRGLAPIHRKIEAYFLSKNLAYERRKGYYKNRGWSRSKVISITELAQAVMAVKLLRPSVARARPTSLLKSEETHDSVFSDQFELPMYFCCVSLLRDIDTLLNELIPDFDRRNRNNIKYHVLTVVAEKLGIGNASWEIPVADELRAAVTECAPDVVKIYMQLGGNDRVAKGEAFQAEIFNHFSITHD